jgi:HEAT repeat protein
MSHENDINEALRAVPISRLVAERMARDPKYAEYIRQTRSAIKPILDHLNKIGYSVDSLYDLRHQGKSWKSAIPVLLHWLPLAANQDIKESIIRCLSVPWTGNKATAFLLEEFKKVFETDPQYAWTIGNALSIVDVTGFEREIVGLCRNQKFGTARQMIVMTLDRLSRFTEAEEAALDLLNDEEVRLHAIIALGKMKSKRALFHLEKLLADKKGSIRKEARKAITKIMR